MARKPTTSAADLTAGVDDETDASPVSGLLGELQDLLPTQTPSSPENASTGLPASAVMAEKTISIIVDTPAQPTLPGFEMADEPLPAPVTVAASMLDAGGTPAYMLEAQDPEAQPRSVVDDYRASQQTSGALGYSGMMASLAAGGGTFTESRNQMAALANAGGPDLPLQGDILGAGDGNVTYESRIRVLEAWQYPGSVPRTAPAFVDRNWVGWADYDHLRQAEPGPCLRVPVSGGVLIVCRAGDYVVRQAIELGDGRPPEVKVEVWSRQDFERIFIPVAMKTVEVA